MDGVTGLAYRLRLSNEQIIVIMKKLDIPVDSPNYILTTKDVKKIKKYVRKNNGSVLKDTFVAAVAILSIYFMFTTLGSSIVSPFNKEVSAPTTSIFIDEESSTRRAASQDVFIAAALRWCALMPEDECPPFLLELLGCLQS